MNKLNFFVPVNFLKSHDEAEGIGDAAYDNMVFEGVASDDSEDDEGECMTPNGFDIERFKKSGYFNLDHLTSRAPTEKSKFWIGEPLDAWIDNNKLFVKGKLWSHSPEARAFWDKCVQMSKSGSNRKPGMSIEGKVTERDKKNPKKILKAVITNIALTFQPINTNSWVSICKGKQSQDFIELENDTEGYKPNTLLEFEDAYGNMNTLDVNFNLISKSKTDVIKDNLLKKLNEGAIDQKLYDSVLKNLS